MNAVLDGLTLTPALAEAALRLRKAEARYQMQADKHNLAEADYDAVGNNPQTPEGIRFRVSSRITYAAKFAYQDARDAVLDDVMRQLTPFDNDALAEIAGT